MKLLKTTALITIIVWLMLYGAFSFANASLNIQEWGHIGRAVCASVMLFASIIVLIFVYTEHSEF